LVEPVEELDQLEPSDEVRTEEVSIPTTNLLPLQTMLVRWDDVPDDAVDQVVPLLDFTTVPLSPTATNSEFP
jgi:hypothetical protein